MKTIRSIRIRLLSIFLTGFILLLLAIVLQTIGGKYSNLMYVPWLWLAALYLAPIIILFQIGERTVKRNATIIIALSGVFVLMSIFPILSQQYVSSSQGILPHLAYSNTLIISALILIPFELFLIYLIRKKLNIKKAADDSPDFSNMDPKVFISYNHNDREVALKIRDAIEKESIEVIIDQDDMMAGADIKGFIEKSIGESTVTVSLVSNNSLKSAWVALETIDTFFLERYQKNKKFIGCYLDDDFLQPDYTLKIIGDIDAQIKANQKLIPEYQQKMIDTRDLNNENTRLLALRGNLDGIVGRLKDSLCLDVREESFNQSMQKLMQAIQGDS